MRSRTRGWRNCRLAVPLFVTLGLLAPAASAEAACKTFKHRAKIEAFAAGSDLAYLNIHQRACYNGRRITKVHTLDVTPTFTDNALGRISWEGVSPKPITEYRAYNRHRKGSYYVKVGANFKQDIPFAPDQTFYIWASMRIFANGTVDKDRHNA